MDTKRSGASTSVLWITAIAVGALSLVCAQRGFAAVTVANAMATTRTIGPQADSSPIALPVSKQPIIISVGMLTESDGVVQGIAFTHVNYLPTPLKTLQFNGQDSGGTSQAGRTDTLDSDILNVNSVILRTAALNNSNASVKLHNFTGETQTATILLVW